MIEIVVLGQPRGKGRPRFSRDGGHVYTPPATAKYEAALKFAAEQVMGSRPPLSGPLYVEIDVAVPISVSWSKKRQDQARRGVDRPTKKPDLDNVMKMVDALNLVAWVDDSQIVDARIRKFYSDKPGVWIRVQPIEEGVFA